MEVVDEAVDVPVRDGEAEPAAFVPVGVIAGRMEHLVGGVDGSRHDYQVTGSS